MGIQVRENGLLSVASVWCELGDVLFIFCDEGVVQRIRVLLELSIEVGRR